MGSAILAAAVPWTFWLAVPLVVTALVTVAAIGVGYHRKVLLPTFQRERFERERGRATAATDPQAGNVMRALRSTGPRARAA